MTPVLEFGGIPRIRIESSRHHDRTGRVDGGCATEDDVVSCVCHLRVDVSNFIFNPRCRPVGTAQGGRRFEPVSEIGFIPMAATTPIAIRSSDRSLQGFLHRRHAAEYRALGFEGKR